MCLPRTSEYRASWQRYNGCGCSAKLGVVQTPPRKKIGERHNLQRSMSRRLEQYPSGSAQQNIEPKRGIIYEPEDLMKFGLLNFRLVCGPFLSSVLPPLGMRISILCQSHCILKAHYLFDFTGTQIERNCSSGSMLPPISPIRNLDDI